MTPGPDDNLNDGLELQGSTGGTGDAKDSYSEAFHIIAVILGVLALVVVGFAMRARHRNKASHNAVLSTPVLGAWSRSDNILINRARPTTSESGHCKPCLGALSTMCIIAPSHIGLPLRSRPNLRRGVPLLAEVGSLVV